MRCSPPLLLAALFPIALPATRPRAEAPELSYSADGKSMILKQGNWTWTFTPSLTRPK